jgi:UDP-glucose 4-epimerase
MAPAEGNGRIIVTGGAGFIGSHVAAHFVASGSEVLVLDDLSTGNAAYVPTGVELVEGDIRDAHAVESLCKRFRPTAVAHLAAQASVTVSVREPELDLSVNVAGTFNICESARRAGAAVVVASTGGALYGDDAPVPTPEDAVARPLAPYGASKLAAEAYVGTWGRLFDLPNVVLRLGNVYGPRQSAAGEAGVVAIFSSALIEGGVPTVFGDGLQTRDYIHVSDVADAFVAAARAGRGGTFNVGWGRETTVLALLGFLAEAAGVEVAPRFEPLRRGELRRSALESTQIADTLGFSPRIPLEDGLPATFAWYAANG